METQSSGLSIASMVCGICALVFTCCIPYVPQILGILGVIFAGVSLSKHMGGKGMARRFSVLSDRAGNLRDRIGHRLCVPVQPEQPRLIIPAGLTDEAKTQPI